MIEIASWLSDFAKGITCWIIGIFLYKRVEKQIDKFIREHTGDYKQ